MGSLSKIYWKNQPDADVHFRHPMWIGSSRNMLQLPAQLPMWLSLFM
ncbi:hypothetical protein MOK15_18865 [Sphingobium sp. BYY-5]|nr:hypothetical protein [Sphingobium sp. BYY-5]MCI4592149.1 hypothetical protein [Sphingobium sp. BYY-5]